MPTWWLGVFFTPKVKIKILGRFFTKRKTHGRFLPQKKTHGRFLKNCCPGVFLNMGSKEHKMSMQLFSRTCCACLHLQGLCLQAFTAKRLKIWTPLRLEKHYRKQKYRNNIQSRDSASPRTCCRMQLRAATKQTDANFKFESSERFNQMRDWEVGRGCHKRFYIGTCSLGLYSSNHCTNKTTAMLQPDKMTCRYHS